MRKKCIAQLIFVLISGFLHAQISTTCVPSVSIVTSAVNSSICIGQSASYTVSGGVSYTFATNPSTSPAFTGTSGVVTPTTHTSYQVIGTNQFGCTSAAQQIIFVNQLPQISISASPTMVCVGFPSTLAAYAAPGNTAYIYSWAQGGNSDKSVVNPTVVSQYTVTGTNTITSCQNTQTVNVAVFNPTFNVTPDTAMCKGNTITLTASGAKTFTWVGGPAPGTGSVYPVSPTVATVYTVSATTSTINGTIKCNSTNTISVGIYPQPTVTAFTSHTVACKEILITLWAKGALTYYWPQFNQSGDSVWTYPLKQTNYKVVGWNSFGCRDTAERMVYYNMDCAWGFAEYEKNSFRLILSPNPAHEWFMFDAPDALHLQLYNAAGVIARQIYVTSAGKHFVMTNDLPAGVYLLTGRYRNSFIREKIIIQR